MTDSNQKEVVVVTGASAGLGRAITRAFASRGARMGLLARGGRGWKRPVKKWNLSAERLCSSANSLVELRVFRGYMLYRG